MHTLPIYYSKHGPQLFFGFLFFFGALTTVSKFPIFEVTMSCPIFWGAPNQPEALWRHLLFGLLASHEVPWEGESDEMGETSLHGAGFFGE